MTKTVMNDTNVLFSILPSLIDFFYCFLNNSETIAISMNDKKNPTSWEYPRKCQKKFSTLQSTTYDRKIINHVFSFY